MNSTPKPNLVTYLAEFLCFILSGVFTYILVPILGKAAGPVSAALFIVAILFWIPRLLIGG